MASETALTSRAGAAESAQHGGAAEPKAPSGRGRVRPAVLWTVGTAIVLLLVSTGIVLWARTRPGFDPFGWLVWGHQTVVGSLDTNAAPSWKPLPYLFTVPYALFGHYQLWLWMITVVAASLGGVVFAARIAHRLTLAAAAAAGPSAERTGTDVDPAWARRAALAAGAFGGICLLGIDQYGHYVLSAQSDPMIVSLCLGAIDCHLSGRTRWALGLGGLAALGRPEVWPFLGIYGIWVWLRRPELRALLIAELVVLLALWFGIPALTSRSPFVSANNALGSGRALHNNKVFGTIGRFIDLYAGQLEVLALLAVIAAWFRRDRVTLTLAAGVVVWVIVEIAFALHGWPGLGRYMFEAAGVMIVIAAAGLGRLLVEAPRLLTRGGTVVGAVAAVLIAASLVPPALSQAHTEGHDLTAQRKRTDEINRLAGTIRRLGGAAHLRQCGEPLILLEYQTVLAWEMGINVVKIGFKVDQAIAHGNPLIVFTPLPDGWKVQGIHQRLASCPH